jgi:hypothetical protein
MSTDTLSRRRLLASVPAVAAAMAPVAASALGGLPTRDDPVFAAIEAHQVAANAFGDAVTDEELDATCDGESDALFELLTTKPTTVAGALAALEYASSPIWPRSKNADKDMRGRVLANSILRCAEDIQEAGARYPAMIAAALRKLIAA